MKLFGSAVCYTRCVIIKDKFPQMKRYDVSVDERIYTNASFRQEGDFARLIVTVVGESERVRLESRLNLSCGSSRLTIRVYLLLNDRAAGRRAGKKKERALL